MALPLPVTDVTGVSPVAVAGYALDVEVRDFYSNPNQPNSYAYQGEPILDYQTSSIVGIEQAEVAITPYVPAGSSAFDDFFGSPGTPLLTSDFFVNQSGRQTVADLTFFYDDLNDFIWFSLLGNVVIGSEVVDVNDDFFGAASIPAQRDFFTGRRVDVDVLWLTWGDNVYNFQDFEGEGFTFADLL